MGAFWKSCCSLRMAVGQGSRAVARLLSAVRRCLCESAVLYWACRALHVQITANDCVVTLLSALHKDLDKVLLCASYNCLRARLGRSLEYLMRFYGFCGSY